MGGGPGKIDMQGDRVRCACASFGIAPHSGIGGGAPSPTGNHMVLYDTSDLT